MNTLLKAFFHRPLTHTLLLYTAIIITTIYAYACHLVPALVTIFAILFAYYLSTSNLHRFITISGLIIISFITLVSIHHQYQQYHSNQLLMHYPVTIEGVITHITHSNLIKEQSTIYIQTNSIKSKSHIKFELITRD